MPYYGIDTFYVILVIPAFIFSLYAQFRVKSVFNKYSRVASRRGITGAAMARMMLDSNGLYDITVDRVHGSLTDHYDPRSRTLRLSESVYSNISVAAIGVAAHETGHALQHKEGYAPLTLRSTLVPIAGIGSSIGPYLAIFGLVFNWGLLVELGIILFTIAVAFYLITLPVEFNASRRAIEMLEASGTLSYDEIEPARKVLRAAAMTYVASAAVAIASLLRLILLASAGRRRE